MAFLIGGANTLDDSYSISNSCRFNGSSSEMEDTLGTPTNIKKFTISLWFKRSALYADISTGQSLISCYRGAVGNPFGALNFGGNDEIEFFGFDDENTTVMNLQTKHGRFRDPSAWYHVVYAVDTTQSTDTNRVKIYVNGVQETSDLTQTTYPSQNKDLAWNQSGTVHYIGHYQYTNATWMNGYEAEFAFIDGSQLTASSFGETNNDGIWIPKEFKDDVTFGNNGYYLEFKQTGTSQNSSGIGADTSGNDRHFAVSNLAAIDITTDTPTNNFATFNPLDNAVLTLSEGNTKASHSDNSGGEENRATIGAANGKWYFEFKIEYTVGAYNPFAIGMMSNTGQTPLQSDLKSTEAFTSAWHTDSSTNELQSRVSGSNTSLSCNLSYPDNGDIVNVAMDLDNGRVYFGKNGTYINDASGNTGNPSTGANPAVSFTTGGHFYFPAIHNRGSQGLTISLNTGNPPFSISSGNADANGYGNFEYAVPSGFYALCTKNLATYG